MSPIQHSRTSHDTDSCYQVLSFILGNGRFGIDIQSVQEIRRWSPVPALPNAPPEILGILNLRGAIVPIVDLRKRLNLDQAYYGGTTALIVVSTATAGTRRDFGLIVDGVSDVLDLNRADIMPAPDLGSNRMARGIQGLVPIKDHLLVLLDIVHLINAWGADPMAGNLTSSTGRAA